MLLLIALLTCLANSLLCADEYVLEISKIIMQRSPLTGEMWAGSTLYQAAEKENWDASIGEAAVQGDNLVFPVNLEIGGIHAGEAVILFVSLDESRAKAGKDIAEYKFEFRFKVFPTRSKEKVYACNYEGWSFKIHYRLTK